MAEVKKYLQMEPIIGDSKNPRYKKAVEIDSWSFEAANASSAWLGDPDKPRERDIHLVLAEDSQAGIQFWRAQPMTNRALDPASFDDGRQPVFKEAVLTIEKVSKDKVLKKMAIYKMSPVIVVAVNGGTQNYFVTPAQVTLRFKRMQTIIPQ